MFLRGRDTRLVPLFEKPTLCSCRSEPLPRLPLQNPVQHQAVPVLPGRAGVRPGPLPDLRGFGALGLQGGLLQELQHPARSQKGSRWVAWLWAAGKGLPQGRVDNQIAAVWERGCEPPAAV